jgi:hypothetical protein
MSFESYLGAVAGISDRGIEQMIQEIIGIFKDPIVLRA